MSEFEPIELTARRIAGAAVSSLALCDSRADGGQREVLCGVRRIAIRRRVQGIAMQLEISAQAYFGVVLSIFTSRDGAPFYRISMPHADADLAIVLYEAQDNRDIAAVWTAWAKFFSIPKLLESRPGELTAATANIGAITMGARPLWRRRGGSLAQRKPKLLNRRRSAHAILSPVKMSSPALAQSEI